MRASLVAALSVAFAGVAHAHPLAPSVLDIREVGGGRAQVVWKTPVVRPRGAEIEPVLPAHCAAVGARTVAVEAGGVRTRWTVDCGHAGLAGASLGVVGPGSATLAAVVRVTLADGRTARGIVSAAQPVFTVPARPRALDVARDYVRLGIAHLASGLDHLLFVVGLILLAGTLGRIAGTVSAFTLGHSVTLTLAALDVVVVPSRLIEVLIAASILALVVELARPSGTLLGRRPWVMACAFGLLHGLGFAAGLREAGLPSGDVPLALVSFNAGIELGQLAFVVAVLALRRIATAWPGRMPTWSRTVPVYGLGALAGYWVLARALDLLRG